MEPQEIQPQAATPVGGQPSNQPQPVQQPATQQPQSLNPQIIKLADSIAKTESGGKSNAKGASGEYGAYQWLPSTWQSESSSAGINVPLNQSTAEQQNQVAYSQISKWKDEGYTPAQIASMWNSGDPHAYLGSFEDGHPAEGTNGSGATYNVPGYVSKVMNLYDGGDKTDAQPPTQTQPQESQPDWLKALEGVGMGAVGWLAGNAGTVAKAGIPIAAGGIATATLGPEAAIPAELGAEALVNSLIPTGSDNQTQQGGVSENTNTNQNQDFLSGGVQESAAASNAVKNAILETMQGTQANRIFSQSKAGDDAISTAANFGLVNPDENGNLQFDEEKLRGLENEIESGKDKVIASQNATASPGSVLNYAGSYIGNNRLATATERRQAAEIARKEIEARGVPTNGEMNLSDMREAQKQHYASAKSSYGNPKTTAHMLAHRSLGNAYGKAIRDKIAVEDQPLYDKLTKMSGDLTRVKDLKKRINGKRAPKKNGVWETFLRGSARYAEAYIGEKLGGPIGAVIGMMAGEHLNRKIDQKFGRNIFETKGMKAALDILKDSKPKEYEMLTQALERHGIKVEQQKENPHENEEQAVKDVKKDLKVIKGRKGLIELPSRR